jgi:hypothetical protein
MAVLGTAPVAMLLYSLVVLWYAKHGHAAATTRWPVRPWYRHKMCPSFEDMLVSLRRASLRPAFDPRAVVTPAAAKSSTHRRRPGALSG